MSTILISEAMDELREIMAHVDRRRNETEVLFEAQFEQNAGTICESKGLHAWSLANRTKGRTVVIEIHG
jgi:hypothetical protein